MAFCYIARSDPLTISTQRLRPSFYQLRSRASLTFTCPWCNRSTHSFNSHVPRATRSRVDTPPAGLPKTWFVPLSRPVSLMAARGGVVPFTLCRPSSWRGARPLCVSVVHGVHGNNNGGAWRPAVRVRPCGRFRRRVARGVALSRVSVAFPAVSRVRPSLCPAACPLCRINGISGASVDVWRRGANGGGVLPWRVAFRVTDNDGGGRVRRCRVPCPFLNRRRGGVSSTGVRCYVSTWTATRRTNGGARGVVRCQLSDCQ